MVKSYQITTLGDLFTVPPERRAAMFKDFEMTMLLIELGAEDPATWVERFEWIDDGISEFGLIDSTTNDDILRLKVRKE